MAEINIERKKGSSIWAWLIPLLLLLALAWWLISRNSHDTTTGGDVAPVATAGAVGNGGDASGAVGAGDATAAGGAPVTDIMAIVAVPDRTSLAGRRVELANVPVGAVTGDETFWVGSSATQQLFVALDRNPSTPVPEESRPNVDAGQKVSVAGVLQRVPSDLTEMRKRWKMDDATVASLAKSQVYLAADRVAITQPR